MLDLGIKGLERWMLWYLPPLIR